VTSAEFMSKHVTMSWIMAPCTGGRQRNYKGVFSAFNTERACPSNMEVPFIRKNGGITQKNTNFSGTSKPQISSK
jgi:hypothetical protein